jgi:hypothetical protein
MTLLSVRTLAVQLSGRYDLINDDGATPESGSDKGMNAFINSGQRYLDMQFDGKKASGVRYDPLAIGAWYLSINGIRAIEDVWVNSTSERWQLERKSLWWMKQNYSELVSASTSGDAMYWAPVLLRGIDVTNKDSLGAFFSHALTQTGYEGYSGVMILPVTDVALVAEISGKFWSPTLSSDSDESYWSSVHEMLLVWASLRQLEVSYRNREGAADWDAAITSYIFGLDKDEIQEQISSVDVLEG